MNKFICHVSAWLLVLLSMPMNAAVTLDADLKNALPSGEFFLPAPPEVGSLIWQDDSVKYFQYKEIARNSLDTLGDQWDSIWAKMNEPYYFALYRLAADSVMNVPFIDVSRTRAGANKYSVSYTRNTTDFPKMNELEELCEVMKTENTSKIWRTRPRPYKYFGEWYSGKKYTVDLTDASSYPSGHGYFAGLFGMCMLYIDPANALAIKKMMDEWAECRLWIGAHWNTDLAAGKQLGAIAFAIAMNHTQFRELVEEAKAELEAYREAHPVATDVEETEVRNESAKKTIENGVLYITRENKVYNLMGVSVE